MKLFYQLTLLLVSLLVITSCKGDDFDNKPVLQLSESSVNFPKAASTETIDVTKNKTDEFLCTIIENSTPGDSWIELTKSETGIKISATQNIELTNRTAKIKVLLRKGDLEEIITVTQLGEDEFTYSVSESELNFSYEEETATIYIETNTTEDWNVSYVSVGGWLTIDLADKDKGKLVLKASANDQIDARETVVTIVFPGKDLLVTVSQRGIIHYDFPLLDIGFNYGGPDQAAGFKYPNSLADIARFEKERGSTWKSTSMISYEYTTTSALFPTVIYTIHSYFTTYFNVIKSISVKSFVVKPFDLLDDPKFQKYLADNGFVFSYKNEAREIAVYWNKEKEVAVQFCNYDTPPTGTGNRLTFIHSKYEPNDEYNQTSAYSTLGSFPYPFTEWGSDANAIAAWESTTGSTLLTGSTPSLQMYTPDPTKDPYCIERAYYMDIKKTPAELYQMVMVFNRIDLGFFSNGYYLDANSLVKTREFEAMLAKEGFVFETATNVATSKHHYYINEAKKLKLDVYVTGYLDEQLVPRLTMLLTPLPV